MKTKFDLLGIFIFCILVASKAFSQQVSSANKKVVFIIVDGIAEDMLEEAEIPNLDQIRKDGSKLPAFVGGIKGSYNETPTISAVGYNSLLTGTWFNKHEVYDNYNQSPNYNYPTLFKIFKEQYPEKKTAIFSTWEDNRTILIGEDLEQTDKLSLDYVFDGYEKDTLRFPHDSISNYIRKIDSLVAQKAAKTIAEKAPDLSWVYLQYSDDIGHRFGNGEKMKQAIAYEDKLVGKIYQAVKERKTRNDEDWLFIVTTDHGRKTDGHGHGGQSDRERNIWIYLNTTDLNSYATSNRVAITDLFPTIAAFLKVDLSPQITDEIDGVNLLNKIDAYDFRGEIENDDLILSWKTTPEAKGKAEILYSTTNNYKKGGKDHYQSLGDTHLKKEKFTARIPEQGNFYKIILKSEKGKLNTWIIERK